MVGAFRVLLAIIVYPIVAIISFFPFGQDGIPLDSLLVATLLNVGFGFWFRWTALVFPAMVFPTWYLIVQSHSPCDNCDLVLEVGGFSLVCIIAGAVLGYSFSRFRTHKRPSTAGSSPGDPLGAAAPQGEVDSEGTKGGNEYNN